jgi:hypothetical protein
MKRLFPIVLLLGGCDWGQFSRNYDGGGKSLCDTPAALFCDDFENTMSSEWNAPSGGFTGTFGYDGARVKSGQYSLVAHANARNAGDTLMMELILAKTLGRFYARVFVWGNGIEGTESIMTTVSDGQSYDGLQIAVTSTKQYQLVDWANAEVGATVNVISATAMGDGWTCLEWHVVASSAPRAPDGSSTLTIDGQEVVDISNHELVTVPAAAPLGLFQLGALSNKLDVSVSAFDVWYDDFVLATQPIGCNP